MNVIRRGAVMRNGGCGLQQEDWSKDYPEHPENLRPCVAP